jgi:hypothetical protein
VITTDKNFSQTEEELQATTPQTSQVHVVVGFHLPKAQCMHLFDQKFTQIHVKILDSLDHQSLESSPHTTPK